MSKSFLLLIMMALCHHILAQNWTNTKTIWKKIGQNKAGIEKELNNGTSGNIQLFYLDKSALYTVLKNTQKRYPNNAFSGKENYDITILQVPMPDGSWQSFQIMESPVMHPVLAEKFPQIKSYKGIGIGNPATSIYFDVSPLGFHGMVLSEKNGSVFIEPLNSENESIYKLYSKKEIGQKNAWSCHVEHDSIDGGKTNHNTNNKSLFCGLKTFRIALSCTGEYAQYFGGTKELALAAMHTTLTRVNGIFERDLSVSLQLVPENDLLVFLNPYSDPYSNNNGWDMLEQNQQTCDDLIGDNNYDIGHVFSTNGGGLAQIRSLCKSGLKAQGVTGIAEPKEDAFDVDYVAHEIGHQFGASHTQNNNCNRYAPTAVEPGSGSSIMGYAGLCHPNVQMSSDAYFHAISIEEITSYLENDGNFCGELFVSNNSITADAGADYIIPKSTPFVLSGSVVTDIPINQILYNWEQMDNEISVMPPNGLNHIGPLFRSVSPSSTTQRFFPNLSSLSQNETSDWEVLANCERDMNFMLSVRSNSLEGSCSDMDEMTVHVVADSGPFKILPTTSNVWSGGGGQILLWDVAGTSIFPVNCQNVDLLLSFDGGLTFPHLLAVSVPNNGEHEIIIPNIYTEKGRVMVKASNNIFFDISDENISIYPSTQIWTELDVKEPKCVGENNGSIAVTGIGGDNNYLYEWSTGSTASMITGLTAGNYSVTVTSENNSIIASAVLHGPPPIEIEFELMSGTNSTDKSLKAIATGGTGDLKYTWEDNGSTDQSRIVEQTGDYSVKVVDENACQSSNNYEVEIDVDVESENADEQFLVSRPNEKKYVHVYPNPIVDNFQIEFYQNNSGGPTLRIFDVFGREMYKGTMLQKEGGLRKENINVAKLKNGCYVLIVEEGDSLKTARVVKI